MRKGRLFDLGEEVLRITVERHRADPDQRIVIVRPHLCKVERVDSVGLGIRIGHDLDREDPAWKGPLSDSLEEVAAVEVSVGSSHGGGLVVGEERHALLGVEVIFYTEFLASGVHPHIRMRTVAVHVAPRSEEHTSELQSLMRISYA